MFLYFSGIDLANNSILVGKIPTESQAKSILQSAISRFESEPDPQIISVDSDTALSEACDQHPPATKSSMFDLIRSATVSKSTQKKTSGLGEIEDYLRMEYSPESECPLEFWRRNEIRLPNLARLARIYLAVPASSGSVERLFSVAGAIARNRRGRTTIINLEKVLCYQQYLLSHSGPAFQGYDY